MAAVVLVLTAPTPTAALRQLRTGTAGDPTAPLVAALTLGAQALVLWLGVVVLLTLAAGLPGLPGRAFALIARRAAPSAVRHVVEVALGITVAVGVVGAVPAAASAPISASALGSTVGAPVPDLDWPDSAAAAVDPTAGPPRARRMGPTSGPTASPARRATTAPTTAPRTSPPQPQPRGTPAAQRSSGGPAHLPQTRRAETDQTAASTSVLVRPGDTLWDLAKEALAEHDRRPTARQVAQSWPRWWAANREVIGPDPDLLLPGTRLSPPAPPGRPPAG